MPESRASGRFAPALGTSGNGSRGMSTPRGAERPPQGGKKTPQDGAGALLRSSFAAARGLARGRTLEIATLIVLAGGALLVIADFLTLFRIESRGLLVEEKSGGESHAYAMLVIGVGVIGAALAARTTEQWPPAAGVALLAVVALIVALAGDLPDATREDLLPAARFGKADPALGFWVELAGAAMALGGGAVMAIVLRRSARLRR